MGIRESKANHRGRVVESLVALYLSNNRKHSAVLQPAIGEIKHSWRVFEQLIAFVRARITVYKVIVTMQKILSFRSK